MTDSKQHSSRHASGELWGLWKLRRYGGNAVLGEQEANQLVDAYDSLFEQVQSLEQERDMYKADRDEYDALLGRKMAERDGFKEQLEAAHAQLTDLRRQMEAQRAEGNWPLSKVVAERDELERAYRQACTNLATIRPDYTRDLSIGETADLYYDALLAGWGGIEGYDPGRTSTTFQWLIERGQPESVSPTVWLEHSLRHPARDRAWTTDAHAAAMFPDRETAETWIADNELEARAVEHGFMGAASNPAGEPQ